MTDYFSEANDKLNELEERVAVIETATDRLIAALKRLIADFEANEAAVSTEPPPETS